MEVEDERGGAILLNRSARETAWAALGLRAVARCCPELEAFCCCEGVGAGEAAAELSIAKRRLGVLAMMRDERGGQWARTIGAEGCVLACGSEQVHGGVLACVASR